MLKIAKISLYKCFVDQVVSWFIERDANVGFHFPEILLVSIKRKLVAFFSKASQLDGKKDAI